MPREEVSIVSRTDGGEPEVKKSEYINSINDYLRDYFNAELSESGENEAFLWYEQYGENEVLISVYLACEQYDDVFTVLMMIPRIMSNRKKLSKMVDLKGDYNGNHSK